MPASAGTLSPRSAHAISPAMWIVTEWPRPRAGLGSAATRATVPRKRQAHNGCNCSSVRSEEHTSELQSLMRISYAVFCLKKKNTIEMKSEQDKKKKQQVNRTQSHTRHDTTANTRNR